MANMTFDSASSSFSNCTFPSWRQIFILGICLTFLSYAYRFITSPLNKFPGPFLSKFSSLWFIRKTYQRRRHFFDVDLHRRYGPVVRVGPKEVSLSSPAAVKAVYGNVHGKSLRKSDWYMLSPVSEEGMDLLSEPDTNKYRLQRRRINPIYTVSSIADLEPNLDAILVKNLASMREKSGVPLDLDNWSHMAALDCLTAAVFSTSTEQVIAGCDDGTIAAAKNGWVYLHWASRFPLLHRINSWCLRVIGRDLWGKPRPPSPPVSESRTDQEEWAISQLDALMSASSAQASKYPPNLAKKLLSLYRSNPSFTEHHMTDMITTHFGAGLETLGITLSAFLCNIIERPALQVQLQEEIEDARNGGGLEFSSEGIVKIGGMKTTLRLLEATLRESMRLHPVIGVSFPRVAGPEGLLIDGIMIPAGTIVGANPWVTGRSVELYGDDAADFRPERWLAMSKAERIRIDTYNQTFGLGMHTCPGKYLAMMILEKLIPMLVMHFNWEFQDPNAERYVECMFGARWKDVKVAWTNRIVKS